MSSSNKLVLDVFKEHIGDSTVADKSVWSFLDQNCNITESYTYNELDKATTALASYLLNDCKLSRGDRVLLVFFPGLAFTASLISCFKAGLIAVPVFPPDPSKLQKDLHHFISIQKSSGAQIALTHGMYDYAKKIVRLKDFFTYNNNSSSWPELRWIQVDTILNNGKSKSSALLLSVPPPTDDDVAFLQYTSGSTSEPKGVMISHKNLAHNLTCIIKELDANKMTICVSWLPQYHDMGLIGSYMGTLYCGGSGYYLSPISFLKDPVVWMKAISKYKGTHTQAPSFAYALVSRKFKLEKKVSLDLGSLKHMINAAEPVDPDAIIDFYETFNPFNLPKGVVFPTYGLAEHTVFVCSGGKTLLSMKKSVFENQGIVSVIDKDLLGNSPSKLVCSNSNGDSADTQLIVGCGFPDKHDIEVNIVDENGNVCKENTVGEVWVTSFSKAKGYWGQEELSKNEFHAAANNKSGDGYLRTGDLGFLHEGELFICGRQKDLIIIRGSNHYPQDFERTAEQGQAAFLRPGCSAAFSFNSSSSSSSNEEVAYIAEIKEDINSQQYPSIIEGCRQAISSAHGVSVSSICLLKTRTIPKTTSGKIARSWCRKAFINGTLQIVSRWDQVGGDSLTRTDVDLQLVYEKEERGDSGNGKNAKETDGLVEDLPSQDLEQIRALPRVEIRERLEKALILVTTQSSNPISSPVDINAPLNTLGLDSMTLMQYKGLLERKFFVDIPDEFMFTDLATLDELSHTVKYGRMTEKQAKAMETGIVDNREGGGGGVNVQKKREPLCPWFTCCY